MPKDQNYQRTKFAFDKVKIVASSQAKKEYKTTVVKLPGQLRNNLIRVVTIIKAAANQENNQGANFQLYTHLSDWLKNPKNMRCKVLNPNDDLLQRLLSDPDSSAPTIHLPTITEELIELATWLKNHANEQIAD